MLRDVEFTANQESQISICSFSFASTDKQFDPET